MPVVDAPSATLAEFYGRAGVGDDAPLMLVLGNCQAESLRVAIGADGVVAIRVPPVFELVSADVPVLRGWLRRASLLVTQPVRDDYRGLPVGTAQLARELPTGARVIRFPVIRAPGLYPAHVIVRPPADPGLDPPVVAYHDLRLLLRAAGVAPRELTPAGVRAVHALGQEELRRRERAHAAVVASDLLERPTFAHMRTLNHPGNPVWEALAERVRERAGLAGEPARLERPLLNAVHAPREPSVIEAFELDAAPRADWIVDGARVDADTVAAAQLDFYARRPDVVAAGLARNATAVRRLGLVRGGG